MSKVLVGLSGGVDSAVAAYLLKEEGYEVVGVMLRTWEAENGEDSRCCEIEDAGDVARTLGIPFHAVNCVSEFEKSVVKPFMEDYINGRTPNPCVICNRKVKFDRMLYLSEVLGADHIATGHYAKVIRLENGRYTVKKALHAEKDQTYMLCRLSQDQLSRILMPLGDLSKEEVRTIAKKAGLSVADKPDSQEICFILDDDYAGFIKRNAGRALPGEGNFVDEEGRVLGRHKGLINYTVGQRRGLGIALGYHAYVRELRLKENEILLCPESGIYSQSLICREANFLKIPELKKGESLPCFVKVRYRHRGVRAVIESCAEEGKSIKVTFEEPVKGACPGQTAVFYDEDDCVIAGAFIDEVIY